MLHDECFFCTFFMLMIFSGVEYKIWSPFFINPLDFLWYVQPSAFFVFEEVKIIFKKKFWDDRNGLKLSLNVSYGEKHVSLQGTLIVLDSLN